MSDIFQEDKIIDENKKEHYVFTKYFYKGNKYYITKDKLIFLKDKNTYKQISAELANQILDEIINYEELDRIEFIDNEER